MKPSTSKKVKVVNKPTHTRQGGSKKAGQVETCGRKEDDGRPGGD